MEVIEPVAFRDRFGVTIAAEGEGMTLAGLRFGVNSLETVQSSAHRGNIPLGSALNALIIPPSAAHGATLIFEPMKG